MSKPKTSRPIAYSYVRFSSAEQAKGNSYRRQLEAAERYAAENNLELSLETFKDLGVSAWQGDNIATGQLGMFLQAVRSGDIAPGSYLLVESLDRVSRSSARAALRALEDIVDAGVTVVTLSDRKVYTSESLSNDHLSLVMSIMIFMRGNEESEIKSARVRDAWQRKKTLARDERRPMTKALPAWLRLSSDRSMIEVDEERAAVVRRIVGETLQGAGQHKIASDLNSEGIETWGVGGKKGAFWHRSYISKIIRSAALIGTLIPRSSRKVSGRRVFDALEPIPNYYPAIISSEEYEQLQERLSAVRLPPMRIASGQVSNVLAGLAKCPLCSSTMTRINKGQKGGSPYLVCVSAKSGAGCEYHAIRLEEVEAALRYHGSQLCGQAPVRGDTLDENWELLEAKIGDHDAAINHLIDEIQGGNRSRALRDALALHEEEKGELQRQQSGLLAAIRRSSGKTLERHLEKLEAVLDDLNSTRSEINTALRALASSVVVNYQSGELEFRWHHSERTTSIMFMWPRSSHL